MEFRILGPVEVYDGGPTRDLGGLRERTLLARLRSRPDIGSSSSPASWTRTSLRNLLPRHARIWPEAAAARLRQALGLWRGPALSDVADFSFAQADVIRLEEARLAALEDRVEADLACGRHGSLASELDGLMARHPLRERLCGQRMLALYRCGRQADALQEYPAARAMYTEALDLATRADDAQQMARALSGLGRLALHQDALEQATEFYTASMARFRQIGDLRRATLILGNLGMVAINQGDLELARIRLEEHLGNARKIGDRKLIGGALTNLGMVAHNAGDLDRSVDLHHEALSLAEQVGDRRLASVALTNLGLVALARKDYAAARSLHARSLELAGAVGELRSIAESLEEIAGVDAASGHTERAAALLGASQALRDDIGSPIPAPDLARFNAAASAVRLALGEERFVAAEARGRALSAAQAAALARQPDVPPAGPPGPGQAAETSAGPPRPGPGVRRTADARDVRHHHREKR